MDDGIFKTGRTMLIGGRRVDVQYMWRTMERAAILEKACRPPSEKKRAAAKQLKLPEEK